VESVWKEGRKKDRKEEQKRKDSGKGKIENV
jgi:hypothetical protein